MARDYFAILGLAPGRYEPATIHARFQRLRGVALRELNQLDPPADDSRAALEELHTAYRILRDPSAQQRYLAARGGSEPRLEAFRRRIAAALEGGLLRHSRRQELLAEGRQLGYSDFHTHLLIAQVQFGDSSLPLANGTAYQHAARVNPAAARLASAVILALALFFGLLHLAGF